MQPDQSIEKVIDYYRNFREKDRLGSAWGQLEFMRTVDILHRYLPEPPADVLDIGGASGKYACLLAQQGYQVTLIDPVPLHVEQAREASRQQPDAPLTACMTGDARSINLVDACAHAILLMGPLYHLTEKPGRLKALAEALRLLKPGGVLFATGISRFASAIDGLCSGYFQDPAFRNIVAQDLKDGRHRNPTGNPLYFTDTFFHHPQELSGEVEASGFQGIQLIGVESIGYMMKDFDTNWNHEINREFLLQILRSLETEPSLTGASPHIMCIGFKRSI